MKNQRAKCPHCEKICNSKAGMTRHINMMHLILSSSQEEQAKKYNEDEEICKCGHERMRHNNFGYACMIDYNDDGCLEFEAKSAD